MNGFTSYDLIDFDTCPYLFLRPEPSFLSPRTLPFFPPPFLPDPADDLDLCYFDDPFDSVTDIIQIHSSAPSFFPPPPLPSFHSFRRCIGTPASSASTFHSSQRRIERSPGAIETHLRLLSDRVSALELGYLGGLGGGAGGEERKYKWTEEVEEGKGRKHKREVVVRDDGRGDLRRDYKWTAEVKSGERKKKQAVEAEEVRGVLRNYKWTAEIKDESQPEGPVVRSYSFKAERDGKAGSPEKKKEEKKEEKKKEGKHVSGTRLVEIEEPARHGVVALRQVGENSPVLPTGCGAIDPVRRAHSG